jgi:hypothetical protein
MRPLAGQGCNKNPPVRADLPLHDLTGGNYWMPDAIRYLDGLGRLRLGGGLTAAQIAGMNDGKFRAENNLSRAAGLAVAGYQLKVINLTGHKLISGYPEGRRMWLHVTWHDGADAVLREDGRYGDFLTQLDGQPLTVRTLIDLENSNTKVYEAHGAMTQEWAGQLITLGYPASLPLSFDRATGAVTKTLGQLAAQAPGTHHETFHFVLNNHLAKDNRIPPYGMGYDEARTRNILPVPAGQYGNPGTGGTYRHFDEITLKPPPRAVRAGIELIYQPTSWEYIQFLYLANTRQNAFLANEGDNLLEAWRNTGMAEPYVMARMSWAPPDTDGDGAVDTLDNCTLTANADQRDTNGDGYGNRCDGDLNNDGMVNNLDLGLFKQRYGGTDPDADFNGDGAVNNLDLGLFKQMYGKPPGPSGIVP